MLKCLFERGTVACGTIRRNQRDLPKKFLGQSLRVGESRAVCDGNMLLMKYKDKREVLVLTSIHPDRSSPIPIRGTTEPTNKPVAIQAYNKYMGGVDLSDQVLQPYNALRKSRAWYKKLVLHLTQIALYNAFILYKNAGNGGKFLDFQKRVIKTLLFGQEEGEGSSASGSAVSRFVPGQHFPALIPPQRRRGGLKRGVGYVPSRELGKIQPTTAGPAHQSQAICINECWSLWG